ncbi:MAG: chromate transporter [Oscillibacter sp.]|nr:chromate transporter [Oscillibacter sp.]
MILLKLYWEFFKTGLFAVGGGMATLPFLKNIGETTGWYTYGDLMNMLAVSESTPGPIGINMATYVGFTVAGVPGALVATLGEVTPSIIVILTVAAFLRSFRENPWVERAFYGLRPASTGLIGAACVSVFLEVLTGIRIAGNSLINRVSVSGETLFLWPQLLLAAVLFLLTNAVPKARDLHPIVFIAFAAAIGIMFRFAGA